MYFFFQFKNDSISLADISLPYLIISPMILVFLTKSLYVDLLVNKDNFSAAGRFYVIPSYFFILFILRFIHKFRITYKSKSAVYIIIGLFAGYIYIYPSTTFNIRKQRI